MLSEINRYFRTRKGHFGDFQQFSLTSLCEFYENIFGTLVYTEEQTHNFIGTDEDGYVYDEIYYPYENMHKKGTIIPKIFLESDMPISEPSLEWKNVAEKGFCVLDNIEMPVSLTSQAVEEAFVPHGLNPELNMSKSIYHAYFGTQANYEIPERHKQPDYMKEMTEFFLGQIPASQSIMQRYVLHTADIVKYIYDPKDSDSAKGPYSFHMDYFKRLLFMFFSYHSKTKPIVGRELLIGKRKEFAQFNMNSDELSKMSDKNEYNPFRKLLDSEVSEISEVKIDNQMLILMNTLNPIYVHKVKKLRGENEVVLLTHYLWSKEKDK